MKDAIKIGDLFIVYDMPDQQPQGFWYQFGKELGILVRGIFSFLMRVQNKSTPISLKLFCIQAVDYSKYEKPTVYRKRR